MLILKEKYDKKSDIITQMIVVGLKLFKLQ